MNEYTILETSRDIGEWLATAFSDQSKIPVIGCKDDTFVIAMTDRAKIEIRTDNFWHGNPLFTPGKCGLLLHQLPGGGVSKQRYQVPMPPPPPPTPTTNNGSRSETGTASASNKKKNCGKNRKSAKRNESRKKK